MVLWFYVCFTCTRSGFWTSPEPPLVLIVKISHCITIFNTGLWCCWNPLPTYQVVLWCSGYHVCFTRRRSRVRNSPEPLFCFDGKIVSQAGIQDHSTFQINYITNTWFCGVVVITSVYKQIVMSENLASTSFCFDCEISKFYHYTGMFYCWNKLLY